MPSALIVEDSDSSRELLSEWLKQLGFGTIETGGTLSGAQSRLKDRSFDLVLLDLSLPDAQGLESLAALSRLSFKPPIVVMTGLKNERVGVEAIRMGALDYLVKGETSLAGISRSILFSFERMERVQKSSDAYIEFPNFAVHLDSQIITYQKEGEVCSSSLSSLEFKILMTLIRHSNETLSREEIFKMVKKDNPVKISIRTIDKHIGSLKKKCPPLQDSIKSIYGSGYVFEAIKI